MGYPWRTLSRYARALLPLILLLALGIIGVRWIFNLPLVREAVQAVVPLPTSSVPDMPQLATPSPTLVPLSTPAGSPPQNGEQAAVQTELVALIGEVIASTNRARTEHGCSVMVTGNSLLHQAAQRHTEDMARRSYFSHVSPDGESADDRISTTGYRWREVAENIAAGYPSPDAVVAGWMNSPGHRANILNCRLTEIGVGYVANPDATNPTYRYLWTQVFGVPQ